MIDKILDRFTRSPLGRKLESEQKAEDLAARRGWAQQRVQLRVDSERRHPALLEAQARAVTRERALEAELLLAREVRAVAARDVTAASLQFDAADGVLVRQLRATADPRIRELKWRLLARGEAARAATRTSGPHPGPLNVVTNTRPEIWGTNAAENARVTEAVLAACRGLEPLELEVLDEPALTARLAEIEASVPAPTEGVPTYHQPDMTPAETRERAWRAAEERR